MVGETFPWCEPGEGRGNWIRVWKGALARLMAQTFPESSRSLILCTFNHTWVWKLSGQTAWDRGYTKTSQGLKHPGAAMELNPPSPPSCALCCPECAAGLGEPHFPQDWDSSPVCISRAAQRRLNGLGVQLSHCTAEILIWIWAAVQAEVSPHGPRDKWCSQAVTGLQRRHLHTEAFCTCESDWVGRGPKTTAKYWG